MENKNQTRVTEFVLFGLANVPELNELLFVIFAVIYLMTLAGNLTIILIVKLDSRLHSPMYFFLSNLALLEIWYTTTTVPKMLADFLKEKKTISFAGCFLQLYFFISLGSTECVLLAMMAYDRYVAITSPLHYTEIMNNWICFLLVATSGAIGFMNGLIQTVLMLHLSFCGPNKINHFMCDILPLVKLSCSAIHTNELVGIMVGGAVIVSSFLLTLISYFHIISTILKLHTAEGRSKAFSTCSSHLTVVSIYFGTVIFMYIRPSSQVTPNQDRVAALFYSVVIPLLNPLIYSFRNRDVQEAIKKILKNSVRF
ncbi:olfactory receptor 1020-like [Rhinatrema bivittatum]|uniref:olfactory receptor 1020-like n=1 Tax=Rhinatrema bivittatum TaxID=194408 RepID=UPI001126DFBC|nr:olfactory receptor 1020-like [Rhinatrema bivittatum]